MTQLTLPIETFVRIPQNDISRYVNKIVETIPYSEFDEFRHHRGATSLMLKIILYAYTQSVFSGRRIEKLLHDSIRMMYLIDDNSIFIDGTKIEATANIYTFEWKKSIQNHESKLNENSKALYRMSFTHA